MTVTIRDVARRLNVSITTVSRGLDGYSDVAEETRQRIIATAREMGYVPSRAARQLRRQRTETIGFVFPLKTSRFNEPFYAEFIAGLGDEAGAENFDLLIATAEPGQDTEETAYARWVQGRKVDGIVLNRIRLYDRRVQYLAQQGFPFVSLERSLDESSQPSVEVDNRAGMARMVAYLAQKGHRQIAYIGAPEELKIQHDRLAGYHDGLENAGLPYQVELVEPGDLTSQGGFLAAQRLLALPHRPTAIACVTDLTAFGVLHAAGERGLQVGKDLDVSGFDGLEESEHTHPPLTTLNQPTYQIARQLVRMLLAELNDETLEERQVCLQPELVVRQSA